MVNDNSKSGSKGNHGDAGADVSGLCQFWSKAGPEDLGWEEANLDKGISKEEGGEA